MVLAANELTTVLDGKMLTENISITHPVLQDLYTKNPMADSVVLVNTNCIIIDAAPDYASIIGQPDGLHLVYVQSVHDDVSVGSSMPLKK